MAAEDDTNSEDQDHEEETEVEKVRIKLKFLNDSHREVEAALSERLGRFKRRNFAEDLADNKTIRLIFNGNVLNGDQQPLSHYGLFDNCVVHCLVSRQSEEQRQQQQQHQGPGLTEPEDNLDLSHMCYPLLGACLVCLWWCQIVFTNYFSMASTISLVFLTVLFGASVYNTYIVY